MTRIKLSSLFVAAVAVSQLGATDCGQILTDPGFDLWCGDRLCYWTLEKGDIEQVPTWIDGDDGVDLVGPDVAISQMTAVNSWDTDCIRFEMLANVEETAEVMLEADVFGDGTIDWTGRIPTSSWDMVSLRIGIRGSYEGVLFRITKVGSGRAVLAQISAEVPPDDDPGCPSFVDIESRPLGASCLEGAECDSGLCAAFVCSTCAFDNECEAGDVCGRVDDGLTGLRDWRACMPAGERGNGDICFSGGECASAICVDQRCGECDAATACADGVTCEGGDWLPTFCDGEPRAAGEPCTHDSMCASAVCDGTPIGSCNEAGEPCSSDADCPALGDLTPGTCTLWAVARGTCQ